MKGLSELKVKDLPDVREVLYKICRVSTPQGVRNYANGIRYGIIVARCETGWLVRLDNDKCIIADTNSLKPL